jgi:hypothetical protein
MNEKMFVSNEFLSHGFHKMYRDFEYKNDDEKKDQKMDPNYQDKMQ